MENSLKLGLVEQYVNNQRILHIVPHSWWEYFVLGLKYIGIIVILGSILQLIHIQNNQITILLGTLGVALFGKYFYDFLNNYLDTVVLTDKGITVINIDNWFSYKVDFFERKSIITVAYTQQGLFEKMVDQGDIKISLDHDSDYTIRAIASPGKQSSIINTYKFDALSRIQEEEEFIKNNIPKEQDKFEVLVDTLSEVIGSYMKHQHNN